MCRGFLGAKTTGVGRKDSADARGARGPHDRLVLAPVVEHVAPLFSENAFIFGPELCDILQGMESTLGVKIDLDGDGDEDERRHQRIQRLLYPLVSRG